MQPLDAAVSFLPFLSVCCVRSNPFLLRLPLGVAEYVWGETASSITVPYQLLLQLKLETGVLIIEKESQYPFRQFAGGVCLVICH